MGLASADALTQLDVPDGENLFTGQLDITSAFYMFSLPAPLRPYSGFRAIIAGGLGIAAVDSLPVRPPDLVMPRLSVAPMGWTHVLWWCQVLRERYM